MKETALWDKLRPFLERAGKFQKISDRFTPGIPDVLGSANAIGYAWELKELSGVRVLKAKFRPGQLDWLRDWEKSGSRSLIVSTSLGAMWAHPWQFGQELEEGCSLERLREASLLEFIRHRANSWRDGVNLLLGCDPRPRGALEALGARQPSRTLGKRR